MTMTPLTHQTLAATLLAIEETGSMSGAAKYTGYCYASIRYHVRQVQEKINSPAISTDTRRGSKLTKAGRWYVETHLEGGKYYLQAVPE